MLNIVNAFECHTLSLFWQVAVYVSDELSPPQALAKGGVTYRDEPWHKECFVCTSCKVQLAGQHFTSRDDSPYCLKCFGNLYAKKCEACNKPITGKIWQDVTLF